VAVERSSDTHVSQPVYSDSKNDQRASSKHHQDSDGISLTKTTKKSVCRLNHGPTHELGVNKELQRTVDAVVHSVFYCAYDLVATVFLPSILTGESEVSGCVR
jgi:hypothetical protein